MSEIGDRLAALEDRVAALEGTATELVDIGGWTPLVYDPDTNLYSKMGAIQSVGSEGKRMITPKEFGEQQLPGLMATPAFAAMVEHGLVEESWEGALAWLQLVSMADTAIGTPLEAQYRTFRAWADARGEVPEA